MWILPIALAAAADCSDPVDLDPWRSQLDALWEIGLTGDDLAFRTGVSSQEGQLSCVDGRLSALDAARLHRNRALLALRSGDPRGAEQALASARRAATASETPEMADAWWERSEELAALLRPDALPPTAEFATSLAAQVFVDGLPSNDRPLGQPVVIQVFGSDGELVDAAWLPARDPLPDWVQYPAPTCEGRRSTKVVVDSAKDAETAFASLDVEGFRAALSTAATALPCVDGVLSPSEAAAIHRLEGVRLYTLGAQDSALRSLQQARILAPLGQIEGEAIAPGTPLARLWDQAERSTAPPWIPIDAPEGLQVRVDGIPTRARPATVPSVVQLTSPTGRVLWTSYVPAMATLPPLDFLAGPTPETLDLAPARRLYLEDVDVRKVSARRQTLLLGGTALVLLSGLAWQSNRNAVSDYEAPETLPERLEPLRRRANGMASASVATGLAGSGLIGAAFLIER